ncbi:hypothetical protein E8E95_00480 [Pseudomonas sp. BN414]|uniref:hypothetical protein n=1 Tax=Pseudomonas sp. BN414 TaxID=2567888 RepID=UPI002453E171|nr:hypothetical protein [Pseudomonas sp. BN414]MDH4565161.1 hypothetical protein [Pseudomonas sp. BN414]
MIALEKRYPRASFSKKLTSMCKKLDEASERLVEYKDFWGGTQSPLVIISSLWVVGSYARGAPECGDLDVVMELSSRGGGEPLTSRIGKAFFGALPLVRYYSGTPDKNTSGVAFPDAVLIWSGDSHDWKGAINSICIDPSAGRAARETDCIPLRDEQLRTYEDELLTVAGLLNEGRLESEFVAFDSAMLSPLPEEDVDETEQRRFAGLGKKSRDLLPALVRLMRRHEPLGEWSYKDVTTLHCGGSRIRLGRPELDVGCFDKSPAIRQLALIPHHSARGPNGAWLLRRGPAHPDVVAIANRSAFLSTTDGIPDLVGASGKYWGSVRILELDVSEENAKKRLAVWQEPDDEPSEVVEIKGRDLLGLICCVDVIEVGDQHFAVSWAGGSYLEQENAALSEIIAALPASRASMD